MKIYLTTALSLLLLSAFGQSQKTEVLMLGTFHFSFPNRDVKKIEVNDQIDVLEPKYQQEIEDIVGKIAKFKPTIIAIEREPSEQAKYDSLYNKFLQGEYQLGRSEEKQIGFRLAKMLGIEKLYCINEWGKDYEDIKRVLEGKDSIEASRFMNFFYKNPDTLIHFSPKQVFKSEGILPELIQMNDDNSIKKDLGNYLIGVFKYKTKDNELFGADFVTGWWFNRNLRIFRNIQKINAKPTDRILVIYGAGHLNILNYLIECSPEYKLVKTNDYLKE
ncbi:MAG: hypothetical protein HOO91_16995 [Bacteroidales bacterium]|nr:hypothetical protein [Bacteroidales bacterium]